MKLDSNFFEEMEHRLPDETEMGDEEPEETGILVEDPDEAADTDCSDDSVPSDVTDMKGKKKIQVPQLISMTKVLFDKYRLAFYSYLNRGLRNRTLEEIIGSSILNNVINREVVTFPNVTYWRIDRENFYADVEVELKLKTPYGIRRWKGYFVCWCCFDPALSVDILDLTDTVERDRREYDLLSKYLVPYSTNQRVDEIAEEIWEEYCKEALTNPTTVITKDLSRIGRDHLQVGFFTDILFREKEIHFIAINNSIDSDHQESSEFAPFLNIMNEWYVRDTSKKIKAVLKARGNSGKAHTSNNPPYGYLKDPDNPDYWVIDEEAAAVVRRIYQMTIEGKGPYTIAKELAADQIERPSYYLAKKGIGNHQANCDKENPYAWRGNQVAAMIARPEYIGKTVNFRTYKKSYKDKKVKRADREDWVVFDGTQDPIVDEETWELAQKLRKNVRKADSMGEPNVLTGRVYCADCGAPMYNHRMRKPRVQTYYNLSGPRIYTQPNPEDFSVLLLLLAGKSIPEHVLVIVFLRRHLKRSYLKRSRRHAHMFR